MNINPCPLQEKSLNTLEGLEDFREYLSHMLFFKNTNSMPHAALEAELGMDRNNIEEPLLSHPKATNLSKKRIACD